MAVSRADVVWAYRNLLGREPENEHVIRSHRGAVDFRSLCDIFVRCDEFKRRVAGDRATGASASLPPLLPPLRVDTEADDDDLQRLWDRIRRTWTSLGEGRPFHSVLTDERFLPQRLPQFEEAFWESGRHEVAHLANYLAELGVHNLSDATATELGCGVGRVTIPLGARCRRVIAYDISEPHLAIARRSAAAQARSTIEFIGCGEKLPAAFEACDLIYTKIVLQHNPPPIIGALLQRLIRALKPGGVGIIQLPTYRLGYSFNLHEYLRSRQSTDMEMHCFPQPALFSLLAKEGARLVELREDDATGHRDQFISNTVVFTR